jgi:DNA-directed RNA polymerase
MIECNLIEVKVVLKSRTEKNSILVPTTIVLDTLGNKIKSQIHLPFRIPMIVKPKPFYRETINGVVKERLGGYLLNDVKTSDSLIIYKWDLKEQSHIKNNNKVYDLVNNINSVGYRINTDVLNFIYKYGVEYDLIEHIANPYENRVKLTKREHILNESYMSKMELQENILGLANVLSKLHEFFIPVRIDNRGRMYCISEYLNYQSNELAKSLLLFSKGEKLIKTDIRGINYFKAYGANCYGNKLDKKS